MSISYQVQDHATLGKLSCDGDFEDSFWSKHVVNDQHLSRILPAL